MPKVINYEKFASANDISSFKPNLLMAMVNILFVWSETFFNQSLVYVLYKSTTYISIL